MRITVKRTGGIAGITLAAELDTATLEPAAATVVERSVTGLLEAAAAEPAPPHPDAFTYHLAVAGRTAVLHERDVPPELRPLLAQLTRRPARPDPA